MALHSVKFVGGIEDGKSYQLDDEFLARMEILRAKPGAWIKVKDDDIREGDYWLVLRDGVYTYEVSPLPEWYAKGTRNEVQTRA